MMRVLLFVTSVAIAIHGELALAGYVLLMILVLNAIRLDTD